MLLRLHCESIEVTSTQVDYDAIVNAVVRYRLELLTGTGQPETVVSIEGHGTERYHCLVAESSWLKGTKLNANADSVGGVVGSDVYEAIADDVGGMGSRILEYAGTLQPVPNLTTDEGLK